MGTPHKHRDVIIAWANGEEIEVMFTPSEGWVDTSKPKWHEEFEYRIKPKRVKKEGWVNVYDEDFGTLHRTREKADELAYAGIRIACIRIEWEEEE